MKIYIIGPTIGYAELNKERFDQVAEQFKKSGHEVVIPHDVLEKMPKDFTRNQRLIARLNAMVECEGFHMITGYANERESALENIVAVNFQLKPMRPDVTATATAKS